MSTVTEGDGAAGAAPQGGPSPCRYQAQMVDSRIEAISPELVLVCPELRATLGREFARQEQDRGLGGGGARGSAEVVGSPAPAPADVLVLDRGPDLARPQEHRLLLAASAYAAQKALLLALQVAAVALAGAIVAFVLVHL
jgi:hypothetical protein